MRKGGVIVTVELQRAPQFFDCEALSPLLEHALSGALLGSRGATMTAENEECNVSGSSGYIFYDTSCI
jgi:hypothetical protein